MDDILKDGWYEFKRKDGDGFPYQYGFVCVLFDRVAVSYLYFKDFPGPAIGVAWSEYIKHVAQYIDIVPMGKD